MTYRSLAAAAGISLLLVAAQARAQGDEAEPRHKKGSKAAPKGDADTGWDDAAKSGDEAAAPDEAPKAAGKPEKADRGDQGETKGDDAHSDEAAPPPARARGPALGAGDDDTSELGPAPERPPIYGRRDQWNITPYGYARLDMMQDSTQSFEDGIQPNLIQRAGTYRGDHMRSIVTARDSRVGLFIGPPQYRGIGTMGQVEWDFYGLEPTDARRHDSIVFPTPRLRLAFVKVETPIVDIYAGQYYDLFGWNGYFYVATVGYLGIPGEVYHRNPQLRLEKKLSAGDFEMTIAVAALHPGQRDSGLPEGQAGLKLAYNGWAGASMFGFGRPARQPLSIGVSGLYRAFEVPVFRSEPGSQSVKTFGWGVAGQLLAPIIPVKNIRDRGNALTLVVEYTRGAGIADMYTFMDGGSRFPVLPNPTLSQPAVIYQANVDPGLVTFDRNLNLATIDWQAIVGNVQYFLPIDRGRVWIEGTYSRIWSDNIKDLTPFPSWGGIFTEMDYFDANLGFDITPAVAIGLSLQSVHQTFGDLSPPTPVYGAVPTPDMQGVGLSQPNTGGVAASARNNRAQLSMALYF